MEEGVADGFPAGRDFGKAGHFGAEEVVGDFDFGDDGDDTVFGHADVADHAALLLDGGFLDGVLAAFDDDGKDGGDFALEDTVGVGPGPDADAGAEFDIADVGFRKGDADGGEAEVFNDGDDVAGGDLLADPALEVEGGDAPADGASEDASLDVVFEVAEGDFDGIDDGALGFEFLFADACFGGDEGQAGEFEVFPVEVADHEDVLIVLVGDVVFGVKVGAAAEGFFAVAELDFGGADGLLEFGDVLGTGSGFHGAKVFAFAAEGGAGDFDVFFEGAGGEAGDDVARFDGAAFLDEDGVDEAGDFGSDFAL